MPRLFSAIETPERVREALWRLKQPLPGARWLDPANYHVTLRFVGDVDNRVADEFAAELGSIAGDPFEARIEGLGTFGGNEPRSIWAGVAGGPALEHLARAHERAARNAGLAPEARNFRAHITMARLNRTPAELVARYLGRNGGLVTGSFVVDRFVLMSSKPKVGGGPYVVEAEYPLGADYGEEAGLW